MSLIWAWGAEENDLTAGAVISSLTTTGGTPTIVTSPVDDSERALQLPYPASTSDLSVLRVFNQGVHIASGIVVALGRFRFTGTPSAELRFIALENSSNAPFPRAQINTSRIIEGFRSGATAVAGSTVLAVDTWHTLKIRVNIADAPDGFWELYVNGVLEATETGVDTLTNGIHQIRYGRVNNNQNTGALDVFYDNWIVYSENGSGLSSDPGAVKIALGTPGAEVSAAFTPSAGTDNALLVDDFPGTVDDDTTYVEDSTAGTEDRLSLATLPSVIPSDADILWLLVQARVRGDGTTSTRQCRWLLWDEAGSQTVGPTTNNNDSTTYQICIAPGEILIYDAAGKTKATVQDFDIGYEPVTSHLTRVTAAWLTILWKAAVVVTAKPWLHYQRQRTRAD